MASIAQLSAILMENYSVPLQNVLNNTVVALEIMKKTTVGWAGKRLVIPVHVARNSGVDFSDSGTLPTAGFQGYVDLLVTAKKLYGTFRLDGDLMAAAEKGGKYAFVAAITSEMDGLGQDTAVKANKALYSGGRFVGFFNQKKTEAGAATWEFAGDAQKLADAITNKAGAVSVEIVRLDTYATIAGANTCDAVNVPALTVHLTAALDTDPVAPGYGCVVRISDADPSLAYLDSEVNGIYGNLASPTHFTQDRTTATGTPALQSVFKTANQTGTQGKVSLALTAIEGVIDAIEEASGFTPDLVLVHMTQRQKYVALMQATIFTTLQQGAPAKEFNGGSKERNQSYGDIAIKADRHCGKGLAIFLKKDAWTLAELRKGGFADEDGTVLLRIAGSDSFGGFWRWYYEQVCKTPNRNGILHGLLQ